MKLRLITLTMNPDTGGFPSEPLADIEGEVMSTSEHFFVHGGLPQLLLIVHYREKTTGERVQRGKSPVKPTDPGVRAVLSDPEKAVFDRLRAWRNGRAFSDGVPIDPRCNGTALAFFLKQWQAHRVTAAGSHGLG